MKKKTDRKSRWSIFLSIMIIIFAIVLFFNAFFLAKEVKKELSMLIHPRNIRTIKMDGKSVDHQVTRNTSVYLVVYLAVFVGSFLLVSIEGRDMVTSFTSVSATLNNTGPGLNDVGPVGNYADFTVLSKLVFIFDMIAGRLELFPILILLTPSAWKKS